MALAFRQLLLAIYFQNSIAVIALAIQLVAQGLAYLLAVALSRAMVATSMLNP